MLTADQKQAFDTEGFLVVEGVLRGELLAEVQREAEALSDSEPEAGRRVWHERALFRRRAFREVLHVPELIEAARELQGDDVQLLAIDLLLVRPGKGGIGWHRDVTFVCNKTLSINTGIYLADMTAEMGPLRVVPGSHRWEEGPSPANGDPMSGEVRVPVPAGSAVFFDAAIWHTGDRNRSPVNRLGLFAYFGHYFIKRMDNYFTQALPADLLATTDPMTRQLLGLGLRPGVPSYHGDDERYNRRGEPGIDFPSEERR
jgi:ectoine hydroxylase-related dioxygenase (phytanoyl-CoA dioxygenase family)